MAAVDKATLKSLRNANNNFSHITDVQNLNAGICESNKAIRGYFPQWLASYYSNWFHFNEKYSCCYTEKRIIAI